MKRIFSNKLWIYLIVLLGSLFFSGGDALATHVPNFYQFFPECSANTQTCFSTCSSGILNMGDSSSEFIDFAWRGNMRSWDDQLELRITTIGVNGFDYSESKTTPGCTCGNGCADSDNPVPIPVFAGGPSSHQVNMSVIGYQLNNLVTNPVAAKAHFTVRTTVCHPEEKAENGACVAIFGNINVPAANCNEPCDIIVSWDTNSHKRADIYKDNVVLWAGVTSPIGRNTDIGVLQGLHTYCIRGYGGSDVQTADLTCGSITVLPRPPDPPQTKQLNVTFTGTGTITSSPAGINCGTDCLESYPNGTVVTLIATPFSLVGFVFSGWSGDPDCLDGSVTMNADKNCAATFNIVPSVVLPKQLTITKDGTGSGTVTSSPGGINCGTDCSEPYPADTFVTLTSTPAAGSTFTRWTGAAGDCNDGSVTMNANKDCTATFNTPGTVSGDVPSLLSTIDIQANGSDGPTTIPYNSSATLSWNSSNIAPSSSFMTGSVTSCTAFDLENTSNPNWSGPRPTSGSQSTGNMTTSTAFFISCFGPTGAFSDVVRVNVSNPVIINPGSTSITIPQQPIGGYITGELWFVDVALDGSLIFQFKMGDVISCGSGGRTRCTFQTEAGDTVHQYMIMKAFPDTNNALAFWNTGSCLNIQTKDCTFQFYPGFNYTANAVFIAPTLTASPNSGINNLNNVSLTVSYPFSTYGVNEVRYQFDCTNDGIVDKDTGFFPQGGVLTYTTTPPSLCNYSAPGIYTAKVLATWRGFFPISSATAIGTTQITVTVSSSTFTFTRPTNGTITTADGKINCGSGVLATLCSANFTNGSTVTLIATADPNFVFSGFGGDPDCTDGIITITPNKSCSATFVGAQPTTNIQANGSDGPTTIPFNSSVGIGWTSSNATSCTASASPLNPNWSGPKSISGSQSILNITTSTTFTLTCTGPGGSVSDSVRVNVPPPDFGLSKESDIFATTIEATIVGTHPVTSNSMKIAVNAFDGFTDTVRFSVQSVSPPLSGAVYNFSKTSLKSGEYLTGLNFSVTVPASTPPGLYTITVEGRDGGLVRTLDVRLNVIAKDPSFKEI